MTRPAMTGEVASPVLPGDWVGRRDRRPAFLIGRLVSLSLAVRLRRQAGQPQR